LPELGFFVVIYLKKRVVILSFYTGNLCVYVIE
jgi:hypothetical protein